MDNDAVAHGMYLLITPLFLRKKKLITTCILCWFGLFGRGSDYIYLLRHAKFADEVFFSLLSSFFFYSFNTCRLFCNHSFSFLMDIALPSIILEGIRILETTAIASRIFIVMLPERKPGMLNRQNVRGRKT